MMFLKTVIVFAAILVGISSSVSSQTSKPREKPTFCEGEECVTLPTRRILKFYKDLLLTKEEIQKKLDLWAVKRKERFGQGGTGSFLTVLCRNPFFQRQQFCKNWKESNQDYDLCCPTQIHHMSTTTMVNAQNKTKFLVKLINPVREQFIPEASCLLVFSSFDQYFLDCVDYLKPYYMPVMVGQARRR
ncbi:hypothetical protein LOTGIDRAFT_169925 [Lottia gigantea]|uniref:Uncharacterized protein n=1 Tax=Lottia gigantea TaxID=225164 RepID=V3ZJB7_LOTGI|nr:hypothetical protein LOTGIDRAFT_169925 [Lottia gigantea]ESO82455.1 hypothetical protein LOTGIDRAFT_169925 [Lottia gigantea]